MNILALFIWADGTREWRDSVVEPGPSMWAVPVWDPVEPAPLALADYPPPCDRTGRIVYFERERRMWPPDWQGPLESWWRWELHTVWEERPPTRPWPAHWPQPPSTVPQQWPVDQRWRLEYVWREHSAEERGR